MFQLQLQLWGRYSRTFSTAKKLHTTSTATEENKSKQKSKTRFSKSRTSCKNVYYDAYLVSSQLKFSDFFHLFYKLF